MLNWLRIYWQVRFPKPASFRIWILLEETKTQIIKAIDEKSPDFPELLFAYLSIALHVPKKYFAGKYWEEVIGLFLFVSSINLPPKHLPLISEATSSTQKKDTWDYPGRTWHLYSHLLAHEYGWLLEYIAKLSVTEALSLIQEILTDEQLDREFAWGMSEKSVSYNPKTKTSKFHELARPYWMRKKLVTPKVSKMPANMWPVGNVNYAAIPAEFQPKTTESSRNMEGL